MRRHGGTRGRTAAKSAAGHVKGHAEPRRQSWSTAILHILVCATTFTLLSGYVSPAPWLFAPLFTGLLSVLVARSARWAYVSSGIGGFLGYLLGWALHSESVLQQLLSAMPAYANPDVTPSLYGEVVIPLLLRAPVNIDLFVKLTPAVSALLFACVCVGLTHGLIAARFVFGANSKTQRKTMGLAGAILLGVLLVTTAWSVTGGFRARIATEPPDESYAFDPVIMLKTTYLMDTGLSPYDAMLQAAAKDSRIDEAKFLKDGMIIAESGWGTKGQLRQPWVFYLWHALGKGVGVFVASLVLTAGLLVLFYVASARFVERVALFIPVLLLPSLLLDITWWNIYHADWWSALAVLYSIGLVMLGRHKSALGAALVAALFREVMVAWLAILLAIGVWAAWRAREATGWERFGEVRNGAIAFVVFWIAYSWHRGQALARTASRVDSSAPFQVASGLVSRPFAVKILAPMSYMAFPYGAFTFPTAVFLPLGLAGIAISLRDDRRVMLSVAGYLGFWAVFYLVFGPASSYWGQSVVPVALLGSGLLAGCPLRRGVAPMTGWLAG